MRRLKRAILHHRAEKMGVKPSLYVRSMWDRIQKKKVRAHKRAVNQQHGRKTKRQWKAA